MQRLLRIQHLSEKNGVGAAGSSAGTIGNRTRKKDGEGRHRCRGFQSPSSPVCPSTVSTSCDGDNNQSDRRRRRLWIGTTTTGMIDSVKPISGWRCGPAVPPSGFRVALGLYWGCGAKLTRGTSRNRHALSPQGGSAQA